MTENTEIPLTGGNVNTVVRVGNTVRRNQTAASASIHRLLNFLQDNGFDACPKFLGVDEKSREVLSFIPGATDFPTDLWTNNVYLLSAAEMLKKFHAITANFVHSEADAWLKEGDVSKPGTVICHNDFAPYNFVFGDQSIIAVIDFDLAGPGDPLTELAYAAHWMVPVSFSAPELQPMSKADIDNGSVRLKQFCRTYGVDCNKQLLDALEAQFLFMSDAHEMTKLLGADVSEKLKQEGHLEHWRKEHAAFKLSRVLIENNFP